MEALAEQDSNLRVEGVARTQDRAVEGDDVVEGLEGVGVAQQALHLVRIQLARIAAVVHEAPQQHVEQRRERARVADELLLRED